MSMIKINCPKCKKETDINIMDAVDEEGEVFKCKHCGYHFRFAQR